MGQLFKGAMASVYGHVGLLFGSRVSADAACDRGLVERYQKGETEPGVRGSGVVGEDGNENMMAQRNGTDESGCSRVTPRRERCLRSVISDTLMWILPVSYTHLRAHET